jgi:galactose mutarotase-like enzyme
VPARTRWLLNWQKVPTGEAEPTDAFFTNYKGALKDYNIDDVFSDLVRDAKGLVTATVKGRAQQIDVTQGPNYRALIVYSPNPAGTGRGSQIPPPNPGPPPPGAAPAPPPPPPNPLATPNFICIEPMAGITNALNLAHRGVYKELQSIPPGGTWQESFWIRARGF